MAWQEEINFESRMGGLMHPMHWSEYRIAEVHHLKKRKSTSINRNLKHKQIEAQIVISISIASLSMIWSCF
jgi:hypothetical protein